MIYCPHVTEESKQQVEAKYSEEFKKYIEAVNCKDCQ